MKFLLPAVLLIASVAADVSHLNNMYLPPSGGGGHHHHHQHAEYADQTNEVPQYAAGDVSAVEHLAEPSNDLSQDAAPQGSGTSLIGTAIFPRLRDEDIRIDQEASAPQEVQVEQHQEAAQFNFQEQAEEQQPAAQEFVPQTFGDSGSSLIYGRVSEQGPAAPAQHVEQYQGAASSSSGIDTQYGSNGGYVY